ncbi:hypothetical protein [Oceanisphaera sp. IT1-181]|uniref:hypothetical protein n=1 Tax=Oceanisphaera sp. IT1-181 TaxID=3081199 RepID=UPI0029C9B51B|nr:hypothetical protein [Oceanisphaera sp. IT1-181]
MSVNLINVTTECELKKLSDYDIEHLYERYLNGEETSSLVKDYNLNIHPGKLISVLPKITLDDTLCPYCSIPMQKSRQTRGFDKLSIKLASIECGKCSHNIYPKNFNIKPEDCECDNCLNLSASNRLNFEKLIESEVLDGFNSKVNPLLSYEDITLFDKIFLLSLLRMQTNNNSSLITSSRGYSKDNLLTSSDDLSVKLIDTLVSCGALIYEPNSLIIFFNGNKYGNKFDIKDIKWLLNTTQNGIERDTISNAIKILHQELRNGYNNTLEDGTIDLFFSLAQRDVIGYILSLTSMFNINFVEDEILKETILQFLKNFSVSEICHFANKAVINSHLCQYKQVLNNENIILAEMLRLEKRALSGDWNAYQYDDNVLLPNSYVGEVFFDLFLCDKSARLNRSPGKYANVNLNKRNNTLDRIVSKEILCVLCQSHSVNVNMTSVNIEVICSECRGVSVFNYSD